MNLLYPVIAVLTALVSFLTASPSVVQNIVNEYKTEAVGAALPQGVAVFETSLQSAITNTADTMTLVSNSVRGGSSLSGYNCFTIDEGRADSEFVCGTISGTTVSGMKRGIDPLSGTSTNATLQFAHRRGASVKVTDFPLIQVMRNQLNGSASIENLMVYSTTSQPCEVGSATGTICAKAYIDGVAVAGASNADDSTKGIVERATASEATSTTATGGTGAALFVGANLTSGIPGASKIPVSQSDGKLLSGWLDLTKLFRFDGGIFTTASSTFNATTTFSGPALFSKTSNIAFGGTGSDGYLNITSGTTTVDCNYAPVCVKNYTDLSITGTGVLAFSNPYNYGTTIILNVQNNATISCTGTCIYLRNMGAKGGTAGSTGGGGGGAGFSAVPVWDTATHGASMTNPSAPGVVTVGAALTNPYLFTSTSSMLASKSIVISPGSGGGGGQGARVISGNEAAGGAGGSGAGALIMQVAGSLSFGSSAIIDARGSNGEVGGSTVNGGVNTWSAGGGGGGAGGMVVGLANTIISNLGSILTSGGDGGNGGSTQNTGSGAGGNSGWSGTGGGGAGAYGGAGGTGGAGSTGVGSGNNGSAGGGTGAGGGGGSGSSVAYNNVTTLAGGTGAAGGSNTIGFITQNLSF